LPLPLKANKPKKRRKIRMEKYEWKTAKGAKVEDVQNATDFERVLAEFIRCVQNQDVEPEPLAYGRATNTEIIGYIEEGIAKIEKFNATNANRAIFRASYKQDPFDPENPYWDIFELEVFDVSEYGKECEMHEVWEHRCIVDDTKEATCYEGPGLT
jgi:hypothetical protein